MPCATSRPRSSPTPSSYYSSSTFSPSLLSPPSLLPWLVGLSSLLLCVHCDDQDLSPSASLSSRQVVVVVILPILLAVVSIAYALIAFAIAAQLPHQQILQSCGGVGRPLAVIVINTVLAVVWLALFVAYLRASDLSGFIAGSITLSLFNSFSALILAYRATRQYPTQRQFHFASAIVGVPVYDDLAAAGGAHTAYHSSPSSPIVWREGQAVPTRPHPTHHGQSESPGATEPLILQMQISSSSASASASASASEPVGIGRGDSEDGTGHDSNSNGNGNSNSRARLVNGFSPAVAAMGSEADLFVHLPVPASTPLTGAELQLQQMQTQAQAQHGGGYGSYGSYGGSFDLAITTPQLSPAELSPMGLRTQHTLFRS